MSGKISSLKESASCFLKRWGVPAGKAAIQNPVLTDVFHHIEGNLPSKMVDWEPTMVF